MKTEEKYIAAFEGLDMAIRRHVEQKRYPAMGYTTNFDLICDFQVEKLNGLIAKLLPKLKLSELKPAALIKTTGELLCTIAYFCVNGIGGEVDLNDPSLMNGIFDLRPAIGGTAAQAAMALAAVGMPSVIHITDDSKEVCEILNSPLIYTVSDDGQLVHTDVIKQKHEQEVHYIIQFRKGDVVRFADCEVPIPVSNRLILTKVTVNEIVPFSAPYFSYIEDHAEEFGSNVLSSFNCLKRKEELEKHIEIIKKHLEKYRINNPKGIVFFEDAHYHSNEIKQFCMEAIYPSVDIVSLNEEELKSTLALYGIPIDLNDILSCVEGMATIQKKFHIKKGVIVHTKDYSIYAGDKIKGCDIETGLIYGNLLATVKASGGSYGTREKIAEILKLPLSEKGKEFQSMLKRSKYAEKAVLVPSKYIDKPKFTIGLGDSFVAGLQICF
ncbi:ADP-dependent glucokinase/phosphofructokinase [[Clostridium] cellulosi]